MKPEQLLPNNVNEIERGGVIIRKGTVGAFSENIRIIDRENESSVAYAVAVADLLSLLPALQKTNFFDLFSVKSERVQKILRASGMSAATEI